MSNHSMYAVCDCSLDILLDGNYSYYQDEESVHDTLESIFGANYNKRKTRNGRYEWEHDDAA